MFVDWPMTHAMRVTTDNRQNPEYHDVVTIRRLRTDKNCFAENRFKNQQHIASKKTCGSSFPYLTTRNYITGIHLTF